MHCRPWYINVSLFNEAELLRIVSPPVLMVTAITITPFQGPIIDFRGLLTDAIKGATSELGLNSFDCNPDSSVSG